jgi:hypothetical protein
MVKLKEYHVYASQALLLFDRLHVFIPYPVVAEQLQA